MAKKNSLARQKRTQQKALDMERKDAEKRARKQSLKKAATVRRMSSLIEQGSDHAALMAAAARAVPEVRDSAGNIARQQEPDADGTVDMGGSGMAPPPPRIPNIIRMLPKAGAWRDRPDRQRQESFDAGGNAINHGKLKLEPVGRA